MDDSNAPKDKFYLTYVLFYSMGVLTLVPSHFFNTAQDYWLYKFRDTSHTFETNTKTDLQRRFTSSFSIVCNLSLMIFIVLTVAHGRRFPVQKRILGGLISLITFFTITMIFAKVNTDSFQALFFGISIVLAIVLCASGAITMISLFQLAARFPGKYNAAIFTGQAICGIFAALAQTLSLSVQGDSTSVGLVYFGVGTFLVVFASLVYLILMRESEFFRYYSAKEILPQNRPKIERSQILVVLKETRWLLIGILLSLSTTVAVQPGLTTSIESIDKGNGNAWNDKYFSPVITFLLHNIVDFMGREVSTRVIWPTNKIVIFTVCLLRVSFIPLFLFCNEQPRHHLPVVFGDATYIIFQILFGFLNGYTLNLCLYLIPASVKPEDHVMAQLVAIMLILVCMGVMSFMSLILIDLV